MSVLLDTPRRPLAAYASSPIWPMFAAMFVGPWFAWPWFAFNAYALDQRTRHRQVAAIGIALLVASGLWFGLFALLGNQTIGQDVFRALRVVHTAGKLAVAYAFFVHQSLAWALALHFGEVHSANRFLVVAVGFGLPLLIAPLRLALVVMGWLP